MEIARDGEASVGSQAGREVSAKFLDGDTNYAEAPIITIIQAGGATDLALTISSDNYGVDLRVPGRMKTIGTVMVKEAVSREGMGTADVAVNAEASCSQSVANPRLASRYAGSTYEVSASKLREVLCLG